MFRCVCLVHARVDDKDNLSALRVTSRVRNESLFLVLSLFFCMVVFALNVAMSCRTQLGAQRGRAAGVCPATPNRAADRVGAFAQPASPSSASTLADLAHAAGPPGDRPDGDGGAPKVTDGPLFFAPALVRM